MKLSTHFTLAEATKTSQPYDNSPDPGDLDTLIKTALLMEEVRLALGGLPVIVTSWYRNERVNRAVGGVPNSQHRLGEAVDFICPRYGSPRDVVMNLSKSDIPFDQLILEPTWVHISFKTSASKQGQQPRREILTMFRNPTRYVKGIAR